MSGEREFGFDTRALHAGQRVDPITGSRAEGRLPHGVIGDPTCATVAAPVSHGSGGGGAKSRTGAGGGGAKSSDGAGGGAKSRAGAGGGEGAAKGMITPCTRGISR